MCVSDLSSPFHRPFLVAACVLSFACGRSSRGNFFPLCSRLPLDMILEHPRRSPPTDHQCTESVLDVEQRILFHEATTAPVVRCVGGPARGEPDSRPVGIIPAHEVDGPSRAVGPHSDRICRRASRTNLSSAPRSLRQSPSTRPARTTGSGPIARVQRIKVKGACGLSAVSFACLRVTIQARSDPGRSAAELKHGQMSWHVTPDRTRACEARHAEDDRPRPGKLSKETRRCCQTCARPGSG